MKSLGRRVVGISLAAGLALMSACGGGGNGGGTQTPVTQPPQPTTSTLAAGTFVGLGNLRFQTFDFASPRAGSLTATAVWTFGGNDVDIYVVSGNTCTTTNGIGTPTGAGCTILCQDISVGGVNARCTTNVTAGNGRLFIVNLGPGGESGTYTITIVG